MLHILIGDPGKKGGAVILARAYRKSWHSVTAGCGEGLLLMCCGLPPVGNVCLARMATALHPIVVDQEKLEVNLFYLPLSSNCCEACRLR